MNSSDVLIVGGGPAGSTCAWKLQQAGCKTFILDKQPFPRVKPCAGWITPQVVQELQLDIEEYRQERTWQPLSGFRCGVIGGDEVQIDYGTPVSYGIRRVEFDDYLLQRSGSARQLGEGVTSIERQSDLWVLNGRYQAPLLVGAGGNFCPVARHLGARSKQAAAVVAQEVEYRADLSQSQITGEMPALYFCPDFLGYGWCFRKGDYLNIGLGRLDANRLSSHVAEFCDFLWERKIVSGERPQHWQGHAYQLYDRTQPVLLDNSVLLIGDAAGLAYRQSGEGIRPAVESALLAADVIRKAAGQYDRQHLAPYATHLLARLGPPQERSIVGWLPKSWLQALATRLLKQTWFCRHVVMDRWFLHSADNVLSL